MTEIDFYSAEGNSLIQNWIREFDELYKKQGNYFEGIKTVRIGGKKLSVDEFLQYKVKLFNNL